MQRWRNALRPDSGAARLTDPNATPSARPPRPAPFHECPRRARAGLWGRGLRQEPRSAAGERAGKRTEREGAGRGQTGLPCRRAQHWPSAVLQSRAVPSSLPVSRRCPSGLRLSQLMPPRWSAQTLRADPPPPIPLVGRGPGAGCAPLGRGAPAPTRQQLPEAAARGHRGAPAPGSCRSTGSGGGEAGETSSGAPTQPPSPPTRLGGDPLETPCPRVKQPQPHLRGTPPSLVPPGNTRTPPEQRRLAGRAGKPRSPRRASGTRGTRGTAHPRSPALCALDCRAPNNTVQPGSSSETTPQPVPSHFSGPRSRRHPPPHPLGTDLSPRSLRPQGTAPRAALPAAQPAPLGPCPLPPRPGPKAGTRRRWMAGSGLGSRTSRELTRARGCAPPPGKSAPPGLPALRILPEGVGVAPPCWRAPLVRPRWGITYTPQIVSQSLQRRRSDPRGHGLGAGL